MTRRFNSPSPPILHFVTDIFDDAVFNEQNLRNCHEVLQVAAALGFPVKATAGSIVHISTIVIKDAIENDGVPFTLLGVYVEEEDAWEALLNWVKSYWQLKNEYPWVMDGEDMQVDSEEFRQRQRVYLQENSAKTVVEEYASVNMDYDFFVQSFPVRSGPLGMLNF